VEARLRRLVRNRILLVTGLLVLAAAAIVGRLFTLQVTGHRRLAARAAEQITEELQFLPKRGVIADRTGRRLAVDVEVDSIYGVPSQVADRTAVARQLAAETGRDPARYAKELAKKRPFVWLERRVSPEVSARIAARKWKGVGFLKENRRFYPQREFGAHVLAFAGLDNQGLAGVELGYDRDLWRDAVVVMAERDAHGNDQPFRPAVGRAARGLRAAADPDAVIQFIAQEEPDAASRRRPPRAGASSCSSRAPARCSRWPASPSSTRTTRRPARRRRCATAPSGTPSSPARSSRPSCSRRPSRRRR
jgi:cell division protein FtsI (penicillin-binding protein 3)